MSETLSTSPEFFSFPGSARPTLSEIGGKALSLFAATEAGLPVPPGLVLSVSFFESWFAQMKSTTAWTAFLESTDDNQLKISLTDLKAIAMGLPYDTRQEQALSEALEKRRTDGSFAVRSSSPEEDLEGTSFAGIYETVLGVATAQLKNAIKKAFVSCLDFRIIAYKREHCIDFHSPRIAVIVQEQIASELSGVGFSLNPLTNNYDEAVFNANFGLGESVVSGLVTPDEFVVDKITGKIKSSSIADKQLVIELASAEGGTARRQHYDSKARTLSDEQLQALTSLIKDVEKLYGCPIDIEWAFAQGRLYLLQARPITTCVILPPKMVTSPQARKRLYIDATIGVQGLYKPISVMGTAALQALGQSVGSRILKNSIRIAEMDGPALLTDGRLYLIASNVMHAVGQKKFVGLFKNVDPLAAETVAIVDLSQYESTSFGKKTLATVLSHYFSLVGVSVLSALRNPEKFFVGVERGKALYFSGVADIEKAGSSLEDFVETIYAELLSLVVSYLAPALVASRIALELIKKLCGPANEQICRKLDQALPHNPTVEMGLALYDVSRTLPPELAKNAPENPDFKQFPAEFNSAWSSYLDRYGHRCAGELDIASPRYSSNPSLLFNQIRSLSLSSTDLDNPLLRYERNRKERESAFVALCENLKRSHWRLAIFKHLYRVWETFGGFREAPKFFVIYTFAKLRERLMEEANKLFAEGRLQRVEQIFDLTLENLKLEARNPEADLLQLGKTNRKQTDLLARVPRLPQVIDSRGQILRPPARELKPGEIAGMAISAGTARGRIKVLNSPDDKPFLRGEVLVARATDPGWTPLFVNASAVILEVGGMLQHGALVAREYGLPCVAGVTDATTIFKDGTMVEVDGSGGVIRLL
jgi:rifampicin phosphotransferase